MARRRIEIFKCLCRGGCGKSLYTTNRSIIGADDLHRQYAGYCSDCLPIDENELLMMQGRAIVSKHQRRI